MTKTARFLLAMIAIAAVAPSINSAFAENNTIPLAPLNPIDLPLKINIISIPKPTANSQNSNPVTVTFNVSSPLVRGICGLDKSYFRLSILSAPPHAPPLAITGLYPWGYPYVANNCRYNMSIAPAVVHGIKPMWLSGIYKAQLSYLVGGQVKANTTFSFMVLPNLAH
ncbi:MAG: hypothetical protein ACE14P_05665 [Methanotrichaceae archaeon]